MESKPKPKTKRKPKTKKEENLRPVYGGIFLCGLFAAAYAVVEGFIFKSSVVMTGSIGTYRMDPITSTLMILAGLIGIGFGIWGWVTGKKLNDP